MIHETIGAMGGVNVEWVLELFEPGTRSWNEQLILKVRPGLRMQEDMIAWADERSEWYSVRSCYR